MDDWGLRCECATWGIECQKEMGGLEELMEILDRY